MQKSSRRPSTVVATLLHGAIITVREHAVMLDVDLADLYGVDVKTLNQAVKRNRARFPSDFMFQLTRREVAGLRSQIVTLNAGRGRHRKYLPFAFTEHGVAMLSSVLRTRRAVQVNIKIMRAFISVRRAAYVHVELAKRIDQLASKCDRRFTVVFEEIRQLIVQPPISRRRIGYLRTDS